MLERDGRSPEVPERDGRSLREGLPVLRPKRQRWHIARETLFFLVEVHQHQLHRVDGRVPSPRFEHACERRAQGSHPRQSLDLDVLFERSAAAEQLARRWRLRRSRPPLAVSSGSRCASPVDSAFDLVRVFTQEESTGTLRTWTLSGCELS